MDYKANETIQLITAEIIFHQKDHPILTDLYVWQDIDSPDIFPRLSEFLTFWTKTHQHKVRTINVYAGNQLIPHNLMAIL